jgi:hypothetical protein
MWQTSVPEPRSSCNGNQFKETPNPEYSNKEQTTSLMSSTTQNIAYRHYTGDRAPFHKSVKAQKSTSIMLIQWQIVSIRPAQLCTRLTLSTHT